MILPPVIRRVLAVLAASLPWFAQPGQAAVDPALRAEYDRAFQQMYRAPDNLDAAFHFAEVAAAAGDLEGAISALERMLIYNPDLPRVKVELGALYLKLGSYDAARTYLGDVLQGDLPPPVRAKVEAMLAEIDARQSPHRISGTVQVGLRYQSNVTASPNAGSVRAFGLDSALDRQFAKQSDGNAYLTGTLRHVYDPGFATGEVWETNLVYYASHQFTVTSFDLMLGELDTGPRFTVLGSGADAVSVRPYLLAGLVGLGHSVYYRSAGGGVSVTVPLGTDWGLDLSGEGRDRDFHATALAPTADGKTGALWTGRARLRYALDVDQQLGIGTVVSRNGTRDPSQSDREWTLLAEYQWSFAAPFAVTDLPWSFAGSLQRTWSHYDAADPTVDSTIIREDRQWLLSATVTASLTPSWTAVLQVQRDWTGSNLPNYRYTNTTALVGAGYSF